MCFKMKYITDHLRGHDDRKNIYEMGGKIIFKYFCIYLQNFCIPSQKIMFPKNFCVLSQNAFLKKTFP